MNYDSWNLQYAMVLKISFSYMGSYTNYVDKQGGGGLPKVKLLHKLM